MIATKQIQTNAALFILMNAAAYLLYMKDDEAAKLLMDKYMEVNQGKGTTKKYFYQYRWWMEKNTGQTKFIEIRKGKPPL